MEARYGIGHSKYVGSMSPDGYPGSPNFEDEIPRPAYGWAPLASQVPLGNDDYTQRVISSIVVAVPDPTLYNPGDKVVLPPLPILIEDLVVPVAGEDFVVSQDIRDYRTGPFNPGPGGEVIVERVRG